MFGLYIHIPYCLQRCSYCDFATYVYDQILPPQEYVSYLKSEISAKANLAPQKTLTSIYFGGGTPSLLEPQLIVSLLDHIAKCGFEILSSTEITIEINPATLNTQKILTLAAAGINRFSVGAQTFDEALLKAAGRKHSAQDTYDTLALLRKLDVNYSFDLLFALPKQSRQMLAEDLKIITDFQPPHLSAYCLTVPAGHPMSFHRAHDEDQSLMFSDIEDALASIGLHRYEISNFSVPGKESQHNLLYWKQKPYLGFGLSAHSYLQHTSPWGDRFWSPSSVDNYVEFVNGLSDLQGSSIESHRLKNLSESLTVSDSLFDFCHTALRLEEGLSRQQLYATYPKELCEQIDARLGQLAKNQLVDLNEAHWKLTANGRLLSNLVFERLLIK